MLNISFLFIIDTYLIVFLYKSEDHALEGKEKHVIPLMDFCGFECRKQYDNSSDVLIIITSSQTSFFSFSEKSKSYRDQWIQILEDQYGQGEYIFCAIFRITICLRYLWLVQEEKILMFFVKSI